MQFLGAITVAQPLCIVSEFMPGGNLADLLAKRDGRPFPIGKSLGWMLDTTKGMRYLHERRPTMIIHRDLKPENLLLDASQRVKITDFGLSKSAMQLRGPRSSMSEEQTVSRTTCGTWLYTAPEVYKKEPYSAKVDQFAFSMIMFELLMGVAPFKALNAEEATVQSACGVSCGRGVVCSCHVPTLLPHPSRAGQAARVHTPRGGHAARPGDAPVAARPRAAPAVWGCATRA